MSPALRRTLAQVRFDTRSTLRNGEQLLLTLLMPIGALVALVVTGLVDLPVSESGQEHGAALASALALAISAAGLPSVAIALAFDRRWGVLRQLSTTPLGPRGLLAGRVGAVLALVAIQVALLVVVALVAGWRPDVSAWPVTVPVGLVVVLLGTAAFTGFGVIVGGTLRAEAVLAIANTLWVLLAAGGGVLAPVATYPAWLGALAGLLPAGALGEALRSLATPGAPDWLSIVVLVAWAVVLPVVAARVVRWEE
ncbi:MAG: ABC transporter permease [Actinomycetaceae bacterium]